MFTDYKQLFDIIKKGSPTTEKRLMVEVIATCEAYNRNVISNVGLVSGALNPAGGLTKPTKCKSMYNTLVKGKDCTPVTQ